MNKYFKALVTLVKDEAKKLREHATPEQKSNLNFDYLVPESPSRCIYGQMTGDCYSEPAMDLICKCAVRVYDTAGQIMSSKLLERLNGAPTELDNPRERMDLYHSPIELFILTMRDSPYRKNRENNKRLIDYIKGVTPELKFKFHWTNPKVSW